jgi:glycosyltransferase involved in cell wall biosynthesis
MTRSLRILMVSDVSPARILGGGERVLWEQASRLAVRGHAVQVLSRCPAGDTAAAIERQGVGIRHFPADRRSPLRFFVSSILQARRAVTRLLSEADWEVLHLYQPFSGYGALHTGRAKGLPTLYTFLSPAPLEYVSRGGMTEHHRTGLVGRAVQRMLRQIERTCLLRATRIHVLSEFSAAQLRELYRIPSGRIVKIPGGADIQRFQPAPDRQSVRKDLGLPTDSPILLTVRNLEARMGLDTLIRAMALLSQQRPGILLLIGGAGSLRGALESLSASLGLHATVRFLGFVPEAELPRCYQAADLFVLPTRELEGFGLTTVEALACGTPVLGTAVGATPEILLGLDASLVLREGSPQAMAEDIRRILDRIGRDPGHGLRQACRRHVENHYTWDACVTSLEAILLGLGSAEGRPAADGGLSR